MGSDSDLKVMDPAAAVLTELGIEHEMRVVSAHRTPHDMLAYATGAADRGLKVIIAGAGGAAPPRHARLGHHIAGDRRPRAAGEPCRRPRRAALNRPDACRDPGGDGMAIGGARNAGLLAARILALTNPQLARALARAQLEARRASTRKGRAAANPPSTNSTSGRPVLAEKRLLITGIVNRESIAYATAERAPLRARAAASRSPATVR